MNNLELQLLGKYVEQYENCVLRTSVVIESLIRESQKLRVERDSARSWAIYYKNKSEKHRPIYTIT